MINTDKAKEYYKELRNWMKFADKGNVTNEIAEERIQTCLDCPRLRGKGLFMTCKECNCFMRIKARFETHILNDLGRTKIDCPLGNWKR